MQKKRHILYYGRKDEDTDNDILPIYRSTGKSYPKPFFLSGTFWKDAFWQIVGNYESRRIFSYLVLNLMFMFVEFLYGWWTNSLGLISDAFHMLFDCMALFIGLAASVISTWKPDNVYSYGYGRVEVLSGFINGIFLIFVAFVVLLESFERLIHPQDVSTDKLLLVSVLGLLVNLVGIVAFHDLHGDHGGHSHEHEHSHSHSHSHEEKHSKHKEKKEKGKEKKKQKKWLNPNNYGVYLHILADTLGSVGVITSSVIIHYTGWMKADPICSFCMSVLIFISVIPLITGSARTLLSCLPESIEPKLDHIISKIMKVDGMVAVKDHHFWTQNRDNIVGTIHLQIGEVSEQKTLEAVSSFLKNAGVLNLTVQIST